MSRYWLIVGGIMLLFLGIFGLVEALAIPLLTNPEDMMDHAGLEIAFLSVALLTLDIFIPVPSSLLMIANGALFGVVIGTSLSLIGSLGAGLVGFGVGRRGEGWLGRFVSPEEMARANRLLIKWGLLAIIVSRPIPIVAETVAVMAGASRIRWRTMFGACFSGALPASLLYAITGATAMELDSFLLTFTLVLAIAGVFWFMGTQLDFSFNQKELAEDEL